MLKSGRNNSNDSAVLVNSPYLESNGLPLIAPRLTCNEVVMDYLNGIAVEARGDIEVTPAVIVLATFGAWAGFTRTIPECQ